MTAECTFFSNMHGTLSGVDHMSGYKTSFNKFKRSKIIQIVLSNYNTIKLEINNRRKLGELLNTWKLNKTLLNKLFVKEKHQKEIFKNILS